MPSLTPADVHNVAFKKPPIGKRGYDEDEVDEFLDLIETELARLIEENNDLKGQVEEIQRRSASGAGADGNRQGGDGRNQTDAAEAERRAGRRSAPEPAPAPVPAAPAPVQQPVAAQSGGESDHIAAVNMLALAQQTADKHVSEAKAESDRVRHETRAEMERLISEARTKADSMQGEARGRAETMERDARTKAAALTAEAERRHNQIMGSLELKKTDLEKAIAELQAYEREYRTRLRGYLESQLQELNSRGSAQPSGAPASVAAGGARPVNGNAAPGQSDGSRSYGAPAVTAPGRHDDAGAVPSGQHSHGG
ncbi:MAG TPA: DivIVA domain-containing protein [Mycobacteriales bacterium]|jgi:DivIVA domain-containing protein|nr:DivIVA domain-containing protein [Mycobacteriales bacterium]